MLTSALTAGPGHRVIVIPALLPVRAVIARAQVAGISARAADPMTGPEPASAPDRG